MKEVGKRSSCSALAHLSMLILFLCLIGPCLSQPDRPEDEGGISQPEADRDGDGAEVLHRGAGTPPGLPVDVLYSGHGFALRGNESYVLRFKIELLLPMEPEQVRKLMASNKSLEEIRDDIQENVSDAVPRGTLIFDRDIYDAVNILVVTQADSSTLLKADLNDAGLRSGNESNAGQINVTISPPEEGRIGRGELKLNQGERAGLYSVLLDSERPGHENRRMPEEEGGFRDSFRE